MAQAGTSLRRAFTNLLEPTKSGAAAMEQLGLIQHGHNVLIDESTGKMKNLTQIQEILHKSMDGLTAAKKAQYEHDIFGQYAFVANMVLANQSSEAYQKLKNHIDSINSTQAAADMLNTFNGHMKQLQAHVATTAKEFGLSFVPVLEKLIPIGNKVVDFLQHMSPAAKATAMGVLGVGSALVVAGGALASFGVTVKFAKEGVTAIRDLSKAFTDFQRLGRLASLVTNPWMLAIVAIATIAILIITHWKQIREFLENTWNAIKTIAENVWTSISNFAKEIWGGITDFFKKWGLDLLAVFVPVIGLPLLIRQHWSQITEFAAKIWNAVTTAVTNIWNGFISWITSTAKKFVQDIVDAFSWLYNHNYYFKHLVDFIVERFQVMKQNVEAVWNAVKTFVTDLWKGIVSIATTTWNALGQFFSTLWKGIENVATAFWNREKDAFESMWRLIVKIADTVFTPIIKFFSGIWNSVYNEVKDVWQAIEKFVEVRWNTMVSNAKSIFSGLRDFFTGLWREAEDWGANLIKMFARGIANTAHEVLDAVKNVAGGIAHFLGFHSPSPGLPDSDQWAPNFVKMFASGIESGTSVVTEAVKTLTRPLAAVGNVGVNANVAATGAGVGAQSAVGLALGALSGGSMAMSPTAPTMSMSRGGGQVTFNNTTFVINGTGKDGRQIGNDIVNTLRQQMAFAI